MLSNFRRLYRTSRGLLARRATPGGVSASQGQALKRVAHAPGLRVTDLARALAVRPSTASNLLLRLEQDGLVRRKRRGKDRREVGVYLTRRGGTAARAASLEDSLHRLDHSLAQLPEPALRRLDTSLESVLELMAQALGDGGKPGARRNPRRRSSGGA